LFFDQPIRGIVGKAVGGVVFVDQCGQAKGLVVLVAEYGLRCIENLGDQEMTEPMLAASPFIQAVKDQLLFKKPQPGPGKFNRNPT
jgi:hypothetical protein